MWQPDCLSGIIFETQVYVINHRPEDLFFKQAGHVYNVIPAHAVARQSTFGGEDWDIVDAIGQVQMHVTRQMLPPNMPSKSNAVMPDHLVLFRCSNTLQLHRTTKGKCAHNKCKILQGSCSLAAVCCGPCFLRVCLALGVFALGMFCQGEGSGAPRQLRRPGLPVNPKDSTRSRDRGFCAGQPACGLARERPQWEY